LGEEYRSLSSSLCSFLHSPVTSSLIGPNKAYALLNKYRVIPSVLDPRKSEYLKDYKFFTLIFCKYILYLKILNIFICKYITKIYSKSNE
jgi:hypothetical protein